MIALFVLGWVLVSSFSLTTTSLVFIALALALIYVMARYSGKATAGPALEAAAVYEDEEGNYEER
ncbi:MAG: hypothetical protein MR611_07935 [Coriobacteriaceae bacterium]|nr:hypothetical protein [Coriobacteriaceae bacterium]